MAQFKFFFLVFTIMFSVLMCLYYTVDKDNFVLFRAQKVEKSENKVASVVSSAFAFFVSSLVIVHSLSSNMVCPKFTLSELYCSTLVTFRMFTLCSHMLFSVVAILLIYSYWFPYKGTIAWLVYTYTHVAFTLYIQFWTYVTLESGRKFVVHHYLTQMQDSPILTMNHVAHALPLLIAFRVAILSVKTINGVNFC